MFMMGEKMMPWTQTPIGHNFGSLRIHSDHTDSFTWESNVSIRQNDIVVDIDKYTNKSINFAVVVYSKGNEAVFDLTKVDNAVIEETMTEKNGLVLKLYALILPV